MDVRRILLALLVSASLAPAAARANPARDAWARGRAAVEAGDDGAARAAFEEAARAVPSWLQPRLELAELAVKRRERIAEERAALASVAGPDSQVPRAHRLLGQLAELAGDDEACAASLGRAIELGLDDADVRAARASALDRLGRFAEAVDEWQIAVRQRPDELHLRARLADGLESAGKLDEARKQLDELIRRQPGKETPVRRLARFLERRGDARAALAMHARADKLRATPLRPQRNLRPLLPSKR